MTKFELLPEGSNPVSGADIALIWPTPQGTSDTVRANVGPWLRQLGLPKDAAVDLVRIAAGALIADRSKARGRGFSRTIEIHVQLVDIVPWSGLADEIADLLHWLTGDQWSLTLSEDQQERPEAEDTGQETCRLVGLFSGGLDSSCGAVLGYEDNGERLLLSHWDNTIVKGAQDRVYDHLENVLESEVKKVQLRLAQASAKQEPSSRSRSFLYIALAVAAASAFSAQAVEVPENGFTSLNPPLGPNRGGALSTRSTHPWTIHRINRILQAVGLDQKVENPYQPMTKGELLAAAEGASATSISVLAADTLSCGKLDGRWYKGGNPNHHCGLCLPCLVRRGAFVAAGVPDTTPYLSEYLSGPALDTLVARRLDDVSAVRLALERGINDAQVMAMGPFPPGFDIDVAMDLCSRGMEELRPILEG